MLRSLARPFAALSAFSPALAGLTLGVGAVGLSLLAGCGGEMRVARVVDGRVLWGNFVDSPSYSTFLKAALEEAKGDRQAALADYELVAREGAEDPEVWTRIAGLLCAEPGQEAQAAAAWDRAIALDSKYGPAWAVKARCALRHGETQKAQAAAEAAAVFEPRAVEPQLVLSTADDAGGHADAARARLVALTLAVGSTPAWDALAAWGRGHGDAVLVGEALAHVAVLDPARRAEIGQSAAVLAGDGALQPAGKLAAAVADAPGDRSSGGLGPPALSSPLVARMAIDDAILAKDDGRARERAARAHVGLDVVAARALLLGEPKLAASIASQVTAADPAATGAALVVAALHGAITAPAVAGDGPVAAEPLLVMAQALARAGATSAAASLVRRTSHDPFVPGDATTTAALVDLGAAGVIAEAELTPESAIELAARRAQVPDGALLAKADARHRLFGMALAQPLDPETARLAQHIGPVAASARDPLVAVALVRLALARGDLAQASAIEKLAASFPGDPLVQMTALEVAKRRGDPREIEPARARLTAIAKTPEERARAKE